MDILATWKGCSKLSQELMLCFCYLVHVVWQCCNDEAFGAQLCGYSDEPGFIFVAETMLQISTQTLDTLEEIGFYSGPYPERPGEQDCAYYMRTGLCGYGRHCHFNHPPNVKLVHVSSILLNTHSAVIVMTSR